MTKSLSYVLFEVVPEGTPFLGQKPSKQKPNKCGWCDWGRNLVSPPFSLDQIGNPEVETTNDIDKMGVTMYYLMSSAMNHAFYQKLWKYFLHLGTLLLPRMRWNTTIYLVFFRKLFLESLLILSYRMNPTFCWKGLPKRVNFQLSLIIMIVKCVIHIQLNSELFCSVSRILI